MAIQGFKRNFEPLEIAGDNQVEAICKGTLQVLEETGAEFHGEKALKLFADSGCKVDFEKNRVRFPAWLVEACLSKIPSSFRVRARDPKNDLILGKQDTTYFGSSCGMSTVDIETWEPRPPTRKEFYDTMKIFDALPNMHMLFCFPYFGFEKVPQAMCLLENTAAKIRNSTKVQMEGSIGDNYKFNNEMAKATGQDLLNLTNPAAPLTYYEEVVNLIYDYAENDWPSHFTAGTVAGATGPATIAGQQLSENAISIAGMVLNQLINPGARIWVGNMSFVQDMRTGSPAFGAIENALNDVLFTQFWRKYKVPTWSCASAWTSSKQIDFQAAYETSIPATISALSGANMIYFQGSLTNELTMHVLKAILDDDIAGMIGRFLRGVEVSDETLAVDLINEVGPIPGHFLNKSHTRQWWKKEQFLPQVADRLSIPEWLKGGKKRPLDHATEKMEHILSTHEVTPLPAEQEQAIEDILNDARQFYRKKGMISDEEWTLYQEDLNSPNYPYA